MKVIFFIFFEMCLIRAASSQTVLSFNTNFYSNDFHYIELYMSNDSAYLNSFSENLNKYSPKETSLDGRRFFLPLDSTTFKVLCDYIINTTDSSTVAEFPQSYREVYFVKRYNHKSRHSVILDRFGIHDKEKAFHFFDKLRIFLAAEKGINSQLLLSKIEKILLTLI